jgi:hypothetical protein
MGDSPDVERSGGSNRLGQAYLECASILSLPHAHVTYFKSHVDLDPPTPFFILGNSPPPASQRRSIEHSSAGNPPSRLQPKQPIIRVDID